MSSGINKNEEKYTFLTEFAKIKYESEVKREDSIIQQASHMQTAFSFITASLFMVAPIVIDNRETLSLTFFLIAFSSITFVLLFSLFLATMAQNRRKNVTFPDVSTIRDYVKNNEKLFENEDQRQKYLTDTFADVQKSKSEINDNRVKWIRASMGTFYIALALCAFWFVFAIYEIV